MSTRDDAQRFLSELKACRPRSFFGKLDETQRGISFVLAYLEETSGEVIAGDLARVLSVSTARIAAMLRTMEKNGLITRGTSAEDARRTVVNITPEGVVYAEKVRESILEKVELLVDRVGMEDLEEFLRISEKMKKALEE